MVVRRGVTGSSVLEDVTCANTLLTTTNFTTTNFTVSPVSCRGRQGGREREAGREGGSEREVGR